MRTLLFRAYFYASLAVYGLVGGPLALVSRRAASGVGSAWSHAVVAGLYLICGARVVIRGREHVPKGAALVACKHLSTLDTLVPFLTLADPAFVFKQELASTPIFGWYLKRAGMIVVERDGHASALRAMLRAAKAEAARGRPIVIFPEGTRQDIGAPPDYKPGVAALYRDLGLACTPVALSTGLVWPAKGFPRRSGQAVIEYLPAIPAGLSREDFMRELETRIETATARLIAEGHKA
jgi:1-acyl-sn-glycerol-3-phosphate acyltransferase